MLQQARARGQALVDGLRRRWDAARQQAAQWVSAARARGMALVQRARDALTAVRRKAAAAVAQAQARLAAIRGKLAALDGTGRGGVLAATIPTPAWMARLPAWMRGLALRLWAKLPAGWRERLLRFRISAAGRRLAVLGLSAATLLGVTMLCARMGGVPTPTVIQTAIATLRPSATVTVTTTPQPSATPTQAPTATPCYLGFVNSSDQLNTNWGFGANENLYNQEILTASNVSGVPAWVLKGLIAVESVQFNPTSVSSSAAYGLTQITGSGMSFLFEKNEEIAKSYIPTAWGKMSEAERALFPPFPESPNDYQRWFKNLRPELKAILNNYTLNSIDGKCTPADVPATCSNDEVTAGAMSQIEIQTNVTYGALILNYSLEQVADIASRENIDWASLPEDEKWKMAIANYNLSAGSGQYLRPAIQACAGSFSWSCVSAKLTESGVPLTSGYADKAINYAQQGCQP